MSKMRMMFVVVVVMLLAGGLMFYGGFTGCSDESKTEEVIIEPPPLEGGGGTKPPEADTTAPTITVRDPAGGATLVLTNSPIKVTFSEAIDVSTVTAVNETGIPVNFTLAGADNVALAGTVTYDGNTFIATFTPANPMLVNTLYTVTVTTGVKDVAGNTLAAEDKWSFNTVEAAVAVDNATMIIGSFGPGAALSGAPQVGVDFGGNAVVVWAQIQGAVTRILANSYVTGAAAWGRITPISNGTDNTSEPQLAVSQKTGDFATGSAIAVWKQKIGTVDRIRGIYWSVAAPRGVVMSISDDVAVDSALSPQVAISADGRNAIVAWVQAEDIWYRKYTFGVVPRMEDIKRLSFSGSGNSSPNVAMDRDGNATIVWVSSIPTHSATYATYCSSGSECGRIGTISGLYPSISHPQVAMDSHGNAIAVWEQDNKIMYNVYNVTAGTPGWGRRPIQIPAIVEGAKMKEPQVVISSTGDITAIWRQEEAGLGLNKIYAVYCPVSDGSYSCGTSIQIDSGLATPAFPMDIAVSNNCAPIVVFRQGGNIWYNKYNMVETTWPNPLHLTESLEAGAIVNLPQIAMADNCSATAVWVQDGNIMGRVLQ